MKSLGRSNDHGYIVEMSLEEFSTFFKLQQVVNREPYAFLSPSDTLDGTDLSSVFSALNALAAIKGNLAYIKEVIEKMDALLGVPEDK